MDDIAIGKYDRKNYVFVKEGYFTSKLHFYFQMADGKPKQFKLSFVENFALSGAAAVISKTAAAPIERVKLLVQNQDEMIKQGKLSEPYKGVVDCTVRTFKTEGELYRPALCFTNISWLCIVFT